VGLERLLQIDRRILYLAIALGTLIPILVPIGFPVSTTQPTERLFEKIESLGPDDVVLISFDYGPTTAPENAPMAEAILRHCFSRRIKVVAIALFPLGGVTMAGQELALITPEFPGLRDGEDYAFLGYKDGAQAAMKQMGVDFAAVFPTDRAGRPLAELPLMARVHNYDNIALIVSLSTNVIAEYWVNLVNAQFRTPVAVGATAVSAPKYFAYLDAGQMLGLLGGVKGASEYERLLIDRYPEMRPAYRKAGVYNAMKGMDAQTIDHAIIMLFILVGNAAFFQMRRKTGRGGAPVPGGDRSGSAARS
jgi:hypothetical protein